MTVDSHMLGCVVFLIIICTARSSWLAFWEHQIFGKFSNPWRLNYLLAWNRTSQVSRNQFDSIIYRGRKRNELVHILFALLSIQKLRFLKLIAYIMNGSFGKQHNRLSQALCWSPTTNFTSKFSVVRLGSGHAPGLLLFGLLCFYFVAMTLTRGTVALDHASL